MPRSTKGGMRVQRYHPALDIGNVLTTRSRRDEPVAVHLRQSDADSACALHCVAMALVMLDLVKRSAIVSMAHRKYGVAAQLYGTLGGTWHAGADAEEIVEALEALELPITVGWAEGFDRGTDAFAVDSLKRVQPTLLLYESLRNRHRHVVLGVGCSGLMAGQKLMVDSLLVLDPSADALPFSCCNGILGIDRPVAFETRRTSVQWLYASASHAEPVRLMSAISILRSGRPLR